MDLRFFSFAIIFIGLFFIFGCAAGEPAQPDLPGFEDEPVIEIIEPPPQETVNESLNGNESLVNGTLDGTESLNGTEFGNETELGYLNGTDSEGNGTASGTNGSAIKVAPENMEMIFLDVGYGDATLIRAEKNVILIDSGADAQTVADKLTQVGVSQIDLLIISSWDAQKTGGVRTIIRDFKVNEIWLVQDIPENFQFESIREYIDRQEIIFVNPKAGQKFDYENIELEVFNPQEEEFLNNAEANSIVLRVSYGEFCAFLPSDLEQEVEALVISRLDNRTCPIYKWRNHGEARPNPSVLFDRISPKDVVISVGPNSDGYPSATTIRRLGIARVGIYRTDLDSDIFVNASFNGTYVIDSAR